MGRKIPGRKHRGVKDPIKQREIRLAKLKNKINAPPIDIDDQQVPKSLTQLVQLKEQAKSGKTNTKRKTRKLGPVTGHPFGVKQKYTDEKPTPVFTQKKHESDNRFMRRVNRVCSDFIKETEFENKYGIDVRRNAKTGEVEITKRKKDELELLVKKARKEKKLPGKKIKDIKLKTERLTKSQKRRLKLKEKKQKKDQFSVDEFKSYEDRVNFGEVVHRPPALTVPKKASNNGTHTPGKRGLLLNSLFEDNVKDSVSTENINGKAKKASTGKIDKKGKRKALPHALRRQLDKQQKEVVEAYKLLKSQKYNSV